MRYLIAASSSGARSSNAALVGCNSSCQRPPNLISCGVDRSRNETYREGSMRAFKRNQVEEAVGRMFDPNARERSPELRTTIKRLLQADRARGRNTGDRDPERANYAFYSSEPPGTGSDIGFSDYDAFALLTGLRILEHGWPQGTVVSDLRRARPRLEKEHAGILRRKLVPVNPAVAAKTARPGERERIPHCGSSHN
jgi:hypothetical protein